jgi:hypothetical protein
MVGCGTSLVDHAASDDQRYPNRAKFAASGRQKGAPGDSLVFRIIIRLENAPCYLHIVRIVGMRDWLRPPRSLLVILLPLLTLVSVSAHPFYT